MTEIIKYVVNDPSSEDLVEINSALAKADQYVREIIVCSDDIEETNAKIRRLVELANKQKENKMGWFSGKKTAIEGLQALADFQADTIKDLWKYQKLVFEQFSKLSETSNKILFLGVANATVTRAIIDQLKTKSSKTLSEDARRHLLNVVKDLERQADVQDRINRLRDTTSAALLMEAQNRKKDIADVLASIEEVKEVFSVLIQQETQRHLEDVRTLSESLKIIKETYALASTLCQERKDRIYAIDNLKREISELETKFANHNASIEKTIQLNSDCHSSKEELLQNEITRLQSKHKIAFWIATIAAILSMFSICANFIF